MLALPPCTRCRSPLEAGDLRCAVCAAPAPETPPDDGRPREAAVATVLRCASCSAAVRYDVRASAPRCAFCGEVMRVEQIEDPLEQASEFLPFRVSRDEAGAALSKWLASLGAFRPS